MLMKQDRKECMFTWTIVHSQNDRKQQEWEEMAESVLICAASTQTARLVIYVMSECLE